MSGETASCADGMVGMGLTASADVAFLTNLKRAMVGSTGLEHTEGGIPRPWATSNGESGRDWTTATSENIEDHE